MTSPENKVQIPHTCGKHPREAPIADTRGERPGSQGLRARDGGRYVEDPNGTRPEEPGTRERDDEPSGKAHAGGGPGAWGHPPRSAVATRPVGRADGCRLSPCPDVSRAGLSSSPSKTRPDGDRRGETPCESPPERETASLRAKGAYGRSRAPVPSSCRSIEMPRTAPRRSPAARRPDERDAASLTSATTADGTSPEVATVVLALPRGRTESDAGLARAVPHQPQRRSKSPC